MEMANKMALAPADGDAPASAEGTATTRRQQALAGQDLVVKYNRGQVLRLLGLLFGMGCSGGVHMPRYRYTLPWADLAEVRLIPLPNPRRRRRRRPVAIVL
jgi:hypothetical protein